MSESHTTRRASKADFREKVERLHLPRNASGQYHHDDLASFILALHRELKGQMNPGVDGPGMEGLLRSSTDAKTPPAIAAVKTKDVATIAMVLKAARAKAESLSTETT